MIFSIFKIMFLRKASKVTHCIKMNAWKLTADCKAFSNINQHHQHSVVVVGICTQPISTIHWPPLEAETDCDCVSAVDFVKAILHWVHVLVQDTAQVSKMPDHQGILSQAIQCYSASTPSGRRLHLPRRLIKWNRCQVSNQQNVSLFHSHQEMRTTSTPLLTEWMRK